MESENELRELLEEKLDILIGHSYGVKELERNFCRQLTYDELVFTIDNGKEALLNKLGISDEDYCTMQRAFRLISAGFTESSDKYDYELEQNNYKALDLFKSLVNDLECVEAERHKVKIGKKEDLGTKISVTGEDAGYKEENDSDLDRIFENSEKSEEKTPECLNGKDDPDINQVFSAETKCDAMHITGDTYNEKNDPDIMSSNPKDSLEDAVNKAIERLDKGCELELDDNVLDAVVDRLWTERDNVSIKINNNKISLR